METKETPRVVVAMSGGVDSSVAALLLKEEGREILGVSMQVWDYRGQGGARSRATCCAPDDFNDARRVAARLEIPYYVFDFENIFKKEVIDRFVASYQRGVTPNPCVDCNNKVKFRELRNRALSFGGSHVATGHYAQIERRGDGWVLKRGKDARKDQSYFLYGLLQEELATTLFPVGHLTKEEVRAHARRAGLVTADKHESQDICFVSGTVREFVSRHGAPSVEGPILDRSGRLRGRHSGIDGFTVGQRRGLGVGGAEDPLYVLEIDPVQNAVIVGPREDLEKESFTVSELNWIEPHIHEKVRSRAGVVEFNCRAQLRYRHGGVPVQVRIDPSENVAHVSFREGWAAVSPGQAAVFYDDANEVVIGGGRIEHPMAETSRMGAPRLENRVLESIERRPSVERRQAVSLLSILD